jgi:imidazole glycerol-phosphate synthase subunit HisH
VTTAAVIDYRVGNIFSMTTALRRAGFEVDVTADPARLGSADAVVLPGVGNWTVASENIAPLKRLIKDVVSEGKPFLGSCLGVQIMLEDSEEGKGEGLGLIKGSVRRFRAAAKVPHMGWNTISWVKETPLFEGVADDAYFYFVHSFYPAPADAGVTAAITTYGEEFTSVIAEGNVCGTQFHPEKSGRSGALLLENFRRMVKR